MTTLSREERFRKAAEAEGDGFVSAGVRISHVRSAVDSGRALYIDLSAVPEDKRPAVVAEIKELVNRAKAPGEVLEQTPNASNSSE